MTQPVEPIEIQFKGHPFGFSARRIYEHLAMLQVDPFRSALPSMRSARDAAARIDLLDFGIDGGSLTGLTLAGLEDRAASARILGPFESAVRRSAESPAVRALCTDVWRRALAQARRRAVRSLPSAFLPVDENRAPLRIAHLRSALREHLAAQARTRAPAAQWLGTVRNLATRGVRQEELERSGLIAFLEAQAADPALLTGAQLAQAIDFSALRLSVIPNITEARTQLRFGPAVERRLPRTRREGRPQRGQRRQLRSFDRVLGYRIEELEHDALWGTDRHWQAVAFDGRVLRNHHARRAIFDTSEDAMARAQEHAREVLPKLLASERWAGWSWTGGADYREWLITLPWFPASYFSSHFGLRNILAHVRCDLREDADGGTVLLLHEVQSDWMQEMRRTIKAGGKETLPADLTPFIQEWPALSLKLMLLHAARAGLDAVAWTRGEHQAQRYDGLGGEGLMELYDRTLPREARKMLKPFGLSCETVDVYVPEDFRIRRVEAVHGVRLSVAARAAILEKGFTAWG